MGGRPCVKACEYSFIEYPADWKRYGRAAGRIRNALMLEYEKPDLVIAFHEDLSTSRGTLDMLKRAKLAGIASRVVA